MYSQNHIIRPWGQEHIKHCHVHVASFFIKETSLKGKNLLPEGANSFLLRAVIYGWKHLISTQGDFTWTFTTLITHLRNCVMGDTPMVYPLHHMPYSLAKFEVATSNNLGKDAFSRKILFYLWPWVKIKKALPSSLYIIWPICICKVWVCYVQMLRGRCIYKKIHCFFTFDLGVKITQNVAQNPMHHLRSLKLLRPTLLEQN